MSDEGRLDPLTGQHTTGHDWDGIEELHTPLPRWWVLTLVLSVAVALVYAWLYPSLPTTFAASAGALGWTSRQQLADEIEAARLSQADWRGEISKRSVSEIERAEDIRVFAITGGRSLFNQNCAGCHGVGGGGQQGQFPSLVDDDWLWGGSVDTIYQTISHGIRNEHDESRQSEMPAFGDGGLSPEDVEAVATYVLTLSDSGLEESRKALPGAPIYETNCSPCHGAAGEGSRDFGAPRLADKIWLYGSTKDAIKRQVTQPRMGMMPAWSRRLGDESVKMLAVYVHSLGGGE
ncbi:MAG: cytochrome-c oxidase, cbb3-type subunit III [Hyphomicrobium sp.]